MNTLNVWILQTGEPLHIDKGNPRPMRAMNLADSLVKAGHKVVLWSAAFNHQEKQQRRCVKQDIKISSHLEIRLIQSPGYKRNIGVGRILDHVIMAVNLMNRLNSEKVPPDVAFIGYPPIEVAAVMIHWLAKRSSPCILDIKDQWPILFINEFPTILQPLVKILLSPYYYVAKRTMREATGLSSMAESFLLWAISFSGRLPNKMDRVAALTTPQGLVSIKDLESARRWWDEQGIRSMLEPRICFIGSHSPAFDINPIYEAAQYFISKGISCEFVICGGGRSSDEWRNMMNGLPNVIFVGWIDRAQIESLAERSTAAIAPYHNFENFIKNIPNKIIDALSLGLPILSPLQGEVAHLINKYNIGLRYGTDSGKSLFQCIELLISDASLRNNFSANALKLYREEFSYDKVYNGLVKHIEVLSQNKQK